MTTCFLYSDSKLLRMTYQKDNKNGTYEVEIPKQI